MTLPHTSGNSLESCSFWATRLTGNRRIQICGRRAFPIVWIAHDDQAVAGEQFQYHWGQVQVGWGGQQFIIPSLLHHQLEVTAQSLLILNTHSCHYVNSHHSMALDFLCFSQVFPPLWLLQMGFPDPTLRSL